MSITIRISDEFDTFIRSKGGFGDNHEDVLRRLTGFTVKKKLAHRVAAESTKALTRQAVKEGRVTPQKRYKRPLMKVLFAAKGHELTCRDALNEVLRVMRSQLKPMDIEKHKTGSVRWENNVQWARNELVKMGFIEPVGVAGHGVWRLTESGVTKARKL